MKKQFLRLLVPMIIGAIIFSGCGKDTSNKPGGGKKTFDFSNSEYTGIGHAGNHYYPRPISIRFNSDSTLTTFTHILLNNTYNIITGKITNVSTNAQGGTDLTVTYLFPTIEQQFNYVQTYTISADKSTLSGGAFPLYELISMKLFPTKAPSIAGNWTTNGYYADIAGITFGSDSTSTYQRGGKTLTYGGDATAIIHAAYHQNGGRLTFIGINETQNDLLIQYYGVITADGKKVYADSYDFSDSRLPSIYGGSEAYGPIGVTPSITKQ